MSCAVCGWRTERRFRTQKLLSTFIRTAGCNDRTGVERTETGDARRWAGYHGILFFTSFEFPFAPEVWTARKGVALFQYRCNRAV